MKTCSICKIPKSIESFNKQVSRKDGHQTHCRECAALRHKLRYATKSAEYRTRNNRRREELKVLIDSLKANPCMDCKGSFHPVAMDFDHRDADAKLHNIASMRIAACSTSKILEEIAKCDLVCSNCHRVRTFKRRSGVV